MDQNLPKRSEVPAAETWDLSDIYNTGEEFEAEMEKAERLSEEFAALEGSITKETEGGAEKLLAAFDQLEAVLMLEQRFLSYSSMLHDQDTSDQNGQAAEKKARSNAAKIEERIAFFQPMVLGLGEETVDRYLKEEPGLRKYEVTIRDLFRLKDHSLSAELEKTAASAREVSDVPMTAASMLRDADLKFPAVKTDGGDTVQITNGRFVPLQTEQSRPVRKEVFEKFYGRYAEFQDVWASLYDGQVKQLKFFSKLRRYPSNFEAAVAEVSVSPAVCDNLFDSVHRHLDLMHRYVRLRRKLLGVDELHMYDVYAPMVPDLVWKVSYEEAKELALKALAPLGEDYLSDVKKAFADRWIDVPENEGKRGGAYSTEAYGVHPYMLLNYNGTLDDVFTLVHEMGHSMHTLYSTRSQTFFNANYRIFVAEVASTTNEILLLEYLLKTETDPKKLAYLVNHYLESFKSTLYRQTMFEEFERKTNEMYESGTPLTAAVLSDTYYQLNKDYFGPDMVSDDLIRYEWCRIPHFYYNFYVYQYATSFASSVAVAHRILGEGEPAVESYKRFLSSGCTQDPVSLLKIAGVDMTTAQPVDDALKVFEEQIARMEKLMGKE